MKFVIFDEAINKTEVAINPKLVRLVRRATNGRALIVFENDHTLTVTGTLEEVVGRLQQQQP